MFHSCTLYIIKKMVCPQNCKTYLSTEVEKEKKSLLNDKPEGISLGSVIECKKEPYQSDKNK